MKKFGILIITAGLWLAGFSQSQIPMKIDSSRASVQYWNKWASDLYDKGVSSKKDSFFVKEEVIKLLKDSSYRSLLYPAQYEWASAVRLLEQMELKKAFWHLINLYQADPKNRQLVLGTFALYDSLMEMDKVLISTYYTYSFPDPRVCRIVNGKPEIYRPDILEKGLAVTREITNYIWAYRKQKLSNKQ